MALLPLRNQEEAERESKPKSQNTIFNEAFPLRKSIIFLKPSPS
jgi:hypothetical protein